MVAEKTAKDTEPPFTIENNVLKGKVVPCKLSYNSIGNLLFDRMKSKPQLIGQVDATTEVQDTYASMLERAIKCALWLKKQGIRRGDIIAVCTHNHLDSFVPCVAALFVGAIFTPWDSEMNIPTARHFIRLSEPKLVFANEASVGVALEAAKIEVFEMTAVVFGDYPGAISFSEVLQGHSNSEVENFRCTEIDSHQRTALILYSSGTTGLPKGIQLSHFSLLHHLEIQDSIVLSKEVPLWFSTLHWISGVLLTLQSIACCTKRIIPPNFEEEVCCKLIEKFKITWLFLSTSMANRFVRSGFISKYDLSSLKTLYSGGAILTRESQEELKRYLPHTTILQAYGMTELGGLATYQLPDASFGSCGVPCINTQIKFIDPESGKLLGPNQSGELCAKTLTVTTGYYRNPEATKNTIDEEGWVHTGDLGYFNEKGEVFIVERLKELIKYRSYHVVPGEIESLLQSHPGVLEVAVVGIPHPTDDEHPVAFVSRIPGTKVTAQELIDLVANNLLDRSKLRGGVKFLEKLPHTASGKIARKELRTMAKGLAVN